jgi:uncharacterized iron-regulated membrane protein
MSVSKTVRPIIFWTHLCIGVTVGLVVLVMSVTGVLLAYEREVLDWAARDARVTPAPGAVRLPLDTVLVRARATSSVAVTAVGVSADVTKPVTVSFADRHAVLVDPYTGHVTVPDPSVRAFFTSVERWHRSLNMGMARGAGKNIGLTLTGACNLAFLFLILSGLYLWFPRRWSLRAFRTVIWFTRGARGRRRDWNWHHVFGFWMGIPLALVVATATFMSYQWPQKGVERLLGGSNEGSNSPVGGTRTAGGERRGGEFRRGPNGPNGPRSSGGHSARGLRGPRAEPGGKPDGGGVMWASMDSVQVRAAAMAPGWQTMQLRFPREGRMMTVSVMRGGTSRPDRVAQLSFDGVTGTFKSARTYADYPPARKVRSWVRGIHTGQAGGVWGETIAALASLAGVMLVWTGIALAWRRLRAKLQRRTRAAAQRPARGAPAVEDDVMSPAASLIAGTSMAPASNE